MIAGLRELGKTVFLTTHYLARSPRSCRNLRYIRAFGDTTALAQVAGRDTVTALMPRVPAAGADAPRRGRPRSETTRQAILAAAHELLLQHDPKSISDRGEIAVVDYIAAAVAGPAR